MRLDIERYIPLLDFFAEIFGNDTEVVLQKICENCEGSEASIIYIRNSISGRKVGSPGTDFLLDVIHNKKYREKNCFVNYTSKTSNGVLLQSSSFFIKDDVGKLIGVICVNINKTKLLELEKSLDTGLNAIRNILYQESTTKQNVQFVNENLFLTADNSIEQTVYEVTGKTSFNAEDFSKRQKMIIVESLYNKGFFELKDAVSRIAAFFEMSEVSIYKYLQRVKK